MDKLKSLQKVLEKLMSGLNFATTFNCIDFGYASTQTDLWISIQKAFKEELEEQSQLEKIEEEQLWEQISEAFAYRGDINSGFQLNDIAEENYIQTQREYKLELRKFIEQSKSLFYLSDLRGNMYYPVFWDFNVVFEIENHWYIIYGLASD